MTIQRFRPAVLVAIVVLALYPAIGVMRAQEIAAKGAPTTLQFDGATRTRTKGFLELSATLTDANHKGISKRVISFYQQVDLLGTRDALLGTAETDSTGSAALTYQPAEEGQQTIIVRFAGDDTYAASEASDTIQVTNAVPPYAPTPEPLAGPARWLPRVLGLLVISVWLLLFGVFAVTAWGIKKVGRLSASEA
jgi:hypothetical protein